jgi:hypothetical protein
MGEERRRLREQTSRVTYRDLGERPDEQLASSVVCVYYAYRYRELRRREKFGEQWGSGEVEESFRGSSSLLLRFRRVTAKINTQSFYHWSKLQQP